MIPDGLGLMNPKKLTFVQKLLGVARSPRIACHPIRGLFVLSHMRSRSSALSHVLGSHPKIVGHGELLRSYRSWFDLAMSKIELKVEPRHEYFHDKLLHNYTKLADSQLTSPHNKILFLMRQPIPCAESFTRLYRMEEPNCNRSDEEIHGQFLEYYRHRIPRLVAMANKVGSAARLIESDSLLDETDSVLKRLSQFLGIEPELSSEFQLFADSGTSGHGDTTGGLESGRLLRRVHSEVTPIRTELVDQFQQVYDGGLSAIKEVVPCL